MKSINTSSDFKTNDKNLGFISKITLTIKIDGIFNIPMDLKKSANDPKLKISFKLYILGTCIDGGKIIQKKFTDEENKQFEVQKAQKNNKSKEMSMPEDYERQISDLNSQNLNQFYEEFENEFKFGSIKFLDGQSQPQKIEDEKKGEDLLILENSVLKHEFCYAYLIKTTQISEDEIAKSKKKEIDGIITTQYFYAKIELVDLKSSDNLIIKGHFPLIEISSTEKHNTRSLSYLKLEIKTDIAMGLEYKKKFNFDITDILKKEQKSISPKKIAEKKFHDICEELFKEFEIIFDKHLFEPALVENFSGFNLAKMEKNSQLIRQLSIKARELLSKKDIYQKFKNELNLLISNYILQKFKIKNFKGVYMNNNDKIYGQVFNTFQEFTHKFASDQLDEYKHTNSISVPDAKLNENDYFKDLESTTRLTPEVHLKLLAEQYFLLGEVSAAKNTIKRALILSPDNLDLNITQFTFLLKSFEYVEAENVILSILGKVYNSLECNYRLTLLFIEKGKVKESVHIIRYMIEKYPNDQIYFAFLWILMKKFIENPSLIMYFQARFYKSFTKFKKDLDFKTFDSLKEDLKPKTLEFILQNDPYTYGFKTAILEQADKIISENDPKKMNEKDKSPKMPEIDVKQKKGNVNKPSAQVVDAYLLKEAKNIAEMGFPRACSFLLELVENKTSLEFQHLDFKVSKIEDSKASSIQKLNSIIEIHGRDQSVLLLELFTRKSETELTSDNINGEITTKLMDSFDTFDKQTQYLIMHKITAGYLNNNEFDLSIQIGVRAIELWPLAVPFWLLVGQSHYWRAEFQSALDYLAYANFLDNHNVDVLTFIVLCLLKNGERCRIFGTLKDLRNVGNISSRFNEILTKELIEAGFTEEAQYFKKNASVQGKGNGEN